MTRRVVRESDNLATVPETLTCERGASDCRRCREKNGVIFGRIEWKTVMRKPSMERMQAALQGIDVELKLLRRERKVYLRTMCVLLVFYLMAGGKVTNWRHKYTKENGSKYRTLWNTEHTVRWRRHAANTNSLRPTWKIRSHRRQSCVWDTETSIKRECRELWSIVSKAVLRSRETRRVGVTMFWCSSSLIKINKKNSAR